MKEIQFIPKYQIDAPPRPNKNVYKILESFSKYHEKETDDLNDEEYLERETLNDVYKALESANQNFIKLLSDLEFAGVISKNDKLFMACLFLTSEIIGPDLKNIYQMIDSKRINLEIIEKEIDEVELPDDVKEMLQDIVRKMDNYFYNLIIREKK